MGTATQLFTFEAQYDVRSWESMLKNFPGEIAGLEDKLRPIGSRKKEIDQQVKARERQIRRQVEIELPSEVRGNKSKQDERCDELIAMDTVITALRADLASLDLEKNNIEFEIAQKERQLRAAQYVTDLNAARLRYLSS